MKRVGLFVGIDRYKNGIAPLNCAVSDATSLMSEFARAQFDVVESLLNEDAHSEKVFEKVMEITGDLKPDDLFVFYFSGHGREFANTHYLVGPTGWANAEFYQKGSLSLPELIAASNKPGLKRLFILDCCRSNILADKAGTFSCTGARDISLNLAIEQNPNAEIIPPLILNSCSTGEQSFEDLNTKHGYFTTALLNCIRNNQIRSFHQFQDNLRISGTPAPQNISWNGSLNSWSKVPLFKSWQNMSDDIDTGKRLFYEVIRIKKTVDGIKNQFDGQFSPEAESLMEIISLAEKNNDTAEQFHYLNQLKEQLEADLQKKEIRKQEELKLEESKLVWNAAISQGIKFSSDRKTLIRCPGSVTEVDIPCGVTTIGEEAFAGCSDLERVNIPNTVTHIEKRAFEGCYRLENVAILFGMVSIGEYAFAHCSRLTNILIPFGVESIGDYAFSYCTGLEKITVLDSKTEIAPNSFPRNFSFVSGTGVKKSGFGGLFG